MDNKKNIGLVIGLGNPDSKYKGTYHSVGIQFIEFLQNSKFCPFGTSPVGRQINSKFLRSVVFMNNSGLFVKQQLKKHMIKPENLLIVHDDADIRLGDYKLSFGRGSAGHKGVQNIIDQLKTKNFWRLRIGIRPPPPRLAGLRQGEGPPQEKIRAKADLLVLKKISPTNEKILAKTFLSVLSVL